MLLRPMLATSAPALPVGDHWTYEVKWDGYRALAVKDLRGVRLISRNAKDLTRAYPAVVKALTDLRARDVILDGEIVALDDAGRPSFQTLQHRRTPTLSVVYYAFDLLQLDGSPLIQEPLKRRRERLRRVLQGSQVLVSEPLPGSPSDIEREIRRLRLEGVVAKQRDSVYRAGERSETWVKVKFSPRQEFAIGGYKPNAANFESILIGYYEKRKFYFSGRVRAGFTPYTRAEVMRRIAEQAVGRCPFVNLPNSTGKSHWGEGITPEDMTTFLWVQPRVVVEIGFVEWTTEGLLRHSTFIGVRDDKRALGVRRETGWPTG